MQRHAARWLLKSNHWENRKDNAPGTCGRNHLVTVLFVAILAKAHWHHWPFSQPIPADQHGRRSESTGEVHDQEHPNVDEAS